MSEAGKAATNCSVPMWGQRRGRACSRSIRAGTGLGNSRAAVHRSGTISLMRMAPHWGDGPITTSPRSREHWQILDDNDQEEIEVVPMVTVKKEDFIITSQSGAALRVLLELKDAIAEQKKGMGDGQ